MPHGDFSDLSALVHFALGGIMCARPELLYQPFPPNAILRPFFDAPPEVERPLSAEMEVMLRFCGGFAIILGCALFTVRRAAHNSTATLKNVRPRFALCRWNTLNGKLTGLGFCGAGANLAHATFAVLDHEARSRLDLGYISARARVDLGYTSAGCLGGVMSAGAGPAALLPRRRLARPYRRQAHVLRQPDAQDGAGDEVRLKCASSLLVGQFHGSRCRSGGAKLPAVRGARHTHVNHTPSYPASHGKLA